VRVGQSGAQFRAGQYGGENGQKMTLSDPSKTGEGQGHPFAAFDRPEAIKPLGHEIRGNIGKMVAGESQARICPEIMKVSEWANLNNVPNFFRDAFHQICWPNMSTGRRRVAREHAPSIILTSFTVQWNI
jgi:hypothetical protein